MAKIGYSPTTLASIGEDIIESAIDWEMRLRGFSLQDGKYVNNRLQVTPPVGGHFGGGVVTQRGTGKPPAEPAVFPDDMDPRRDIYDAIRISVQDAFKPYFYLQDPSAFGRATNALHDAAALLARTAFVDNGELRGGNYGLHGISHIHTKVGHFNGTVIDAFDKDFVSQIDDVVDGQCAAATVVGSVVTAERRLIDVARHDCIDIAARALQAMKAKNAGKGIPYTLRVAGILSATAAVFVTGGAFGAVAGTASSVLGIFGRVFPDKDPATNPGGTFAGEDWHHVMAKVEKALKDLSTEIERRESFLKGVCERALSTMTGASTVRSFDIAAPSEFLATHDHLDTKLGLLSPFGAGDAAPGIRLDLNSLRTVAQEDMPEIATQFGLAAKSLLAGIEAVREDEWDRAGRGGFDPVGYGDVGPFHAWRSLAVHLYELTRDTEWEIRKSAHHLEVATNLLYTSDVNVEAQLARDTRKVAAGSPYVS